MFRTTLVTVGLLSLISTAVAQLPRREPTPNDTLVSVEPSADKKVTFRLYAPKATDVTVSGEFADGPPVKMTKDDKGVWSATVGPLKPDYYSYSFAVDGVRTLDPKSGNVKIGLNNTTSLYFLAGPEADFQDVKKVPHGDVRQVWYESATLGGQRRMHVYTPPGYDAATDKYPVFYLLHGGGDEDSGWSTVGRAGLILDNLIAAKKAKPMLVVMPNGSLPRPTGGGNPASAQDRFTNELLKDVIPHVEKSFRVKVGPENRALAGLSMGGGQTLRVLTTNPDQFAYVGIWSARLFGGNAEQFEKQNEAFLKDANKVNKAVKHFEVVVGDKDFALPGSKALVGVLEKHKIKHAFRLTGGGHTWTNWRAYLNELAPKLFQ